MTAQGWDPAAYCDHAGFVPVLGEPLVLLLAPRPGEYILDLGCGEGSLTGVIGASGCRVLGIDADPGMIARARERGLEVRLLDAHDLSADAEFDAVFSNAALHWMNDPDRVVDNVYRALRPGGRFVGEFGGEGNIASVIHAIGQVFARNPDYGEFRNPWYFPSPERYRETLERAGFRVTRIELFPRPTAVPGGAFAWLEIFAHGIAAGLPISKRETFLAQTAAILDPRETAGEWVADYVRLRFEAVKG